MMVDSAPFGIDWQSPPFDLFVGVHRLAAERSGHASAAHARHQLYAARDTRSQVNVLIKVTTKPGLVYERDLVNEAAGLATINRELPDSRHFPMLVEHGRLRDDHRRGARRSQRRSDAISHVGLGTRRRPSARRSAPGG